MRKGVTGEQRQNPHEPVIDDEGIARERGDPLADGPLLRGDERVADHGVGQVRLLGRGDSTDLELADRDELVVPHNVGIHPGAGLQLQGSPGCVEGPDPRERASEVPDGQLGAAVEHPAEVGVLGQDQVHIAAVLEQLDLLGHPRLGHPPGVDGLAEVDNVERFARLVADQRQGGASPDRLAVGPQEPPLDRPRSHLPGQELPDQGEGLRHVLGVGDRGDALGVQLLQGIAHQRLEGSVGVEVAAHDVGHRDPDLRLLKQGSGLRPGLPPILLSGPPLGPVDDHPDATDHRPGIASSLV